MHLKLSKSKNLKGQVTIPGDKSISHRSIILSSLAEGTSEISGFLKGEDCLATLDSFKKMGVKIEEEDEKISVHGVGLHGLKKPTENLFEIGDVIYIPTPLVKILEALEE